MNEVLSTPETNEEATAEALPQPVPLTLLPKILEALLFASQKGISTKELLGFLKAAAQADPNGPAAAFHKIQEADLREALEKLKEELVATERSYELREASSGWQLMTRPFFAPWLRQLFPEARPSRLSPPALETLAIIAYRQPITRADIEAVRGVAVDGVVQTLLERGLITIAGRSELPGRPLLYATSNFFLDHFGLRNLEELPNATELRHVALPKAVTDELASNEPQPPLTGE